LAITLALLCLFRAGPADGADLAADTGPGPLPVTSAEYRLPATLDPSVAEEIVTELWARVYRPKRLDAGPYPVLLFLHGNHATCGRPDPALGVRVDDDITYTTTGTCPSGYVVVPSHKGYGYLAGRLASWGYVVVSINANRGVNAADGVDGDFGLNLRRGRLALRHLQLLSGWNRSGGTPASLGVELRGKLDLGQIGLLGHSRGGEGMRAALDQLREPGSPWPGRLGRSAVIRALFEIGPVDGQTARVLDARGIPWNVLLPMCDGDVSSLEGVRPFERMLARRTEPARQPKSTYTVWGANHNFYNTEWQISESRGCTGHKPLFGQLAPSRDQEETALRSAVAFFRAHVGRERVPALATLLNPDVRLPAFVRQVTRIERGYTDTPDQRVSLRFEEFDRFTGRNTHGALNNAVGVKVEHGIIGDFTHDPNQRVAAIGWNNRGASRAAGSIYFQTNWTAPGSSRDVSAYRVLEFRISQRCPFVGDCFQPSPLNPPGQLDLSIRLVRSDGTLSGSIPLRRFASVRGLVGGLDSPLHAILQTVRIPLEAFGPGAARDLRGIRFVFDRSLSGEISLANIRLSTRRAQPAAGAAVAEASPDAGTVPSTAMASGQRREAPDEVNRIVAIRSVAPPADALSAERAAGVRVEIELASSRGPFPVTDALPILRIGAHELRVSRFAGTPKGSRLVFELDAAAFDRLQQGARVTLEMGARAPWTFGSLDKSALR
jgi:hypothetical protein